MAATATPYGLKVVKMAYGRDTNGGTTSLFRIKSGYNQIIPFGAPVRMSTTNDPTTGYGNGYVVNISSGTMNQSGVLDQYVGVFLGCSYTNPTTGQLEFNQWYPGNLVATDITAYVSADPEMTYQVQCTTAGFDALSNVGYSYDLNVPATPYTTASKDSTITLAVGNGTGATKPWKVLTVASVVGNTNGAGFVDVVVKINTGYHIFTRTQ